MLRVLQLTCQKDRRACFDVVMLNAAKVMYLKEP